MNCSPRRPPRPAGNRRRRTRSGCGTNSSASSTSCCRNPSRIFPRGTRKRAIDKAVAFVKERLNGEDGLGAIFPAMVNSVLMFDALGVPPDNPERAIARKSVDKLLVVKQDEAYCQPCVSPVWDTALAAHALLEAGHQANVAHAEQGLQWLKPLQELDVKGDWAFKRPQAVPGGWAFQYANPHYPDLDDTAVIVMAMARAQKDDEARPYDEAIARARQWIEALQSDDGGWGAFDADNTHEFLNNIPFADHGALLDPPSPDLTARCLSMLAQLGVTPDASQAMRRGIDYLRRTQLPDGSWYGRWGVNYIYGTWSSLCALNAAGLPHDAPEIETRRRLAGRDPERGRRLGRGRRQLQARLSRPRGKPEHALADRLGPARPDGGRRGRSSGGRARRPIPAGHTRTTKGSGASAITPERAFRACSTCAIMAIRNFFRCGRWPDSAT